MEKEFLSGNKEAIRTKYWKEGPAAFNDRELLALLMTYAVPEDRIGEIVYKLFNEYDSLWNLVKLNSFDSKKIQEYGEAGAVFLLMFMEIVKRYNNEHATEKLCLDARERSGEYAVSLLEYERNECFYLISLDSQHNKINESVLSRGSVDETHVYIRNVVEQVKKDHAKEVIIAHNHPGGSLQPSDADISLTIEIKDALNKIKVKLTEHIIVADDKYYHITALDMMDFVMKYP